MTDKTNRIVISGKAAEQTTWGLRHFILDQRKHPPNIISFYPETRHMFSNIIITIISIDRYSPPMKAKPNFKIELLWD